jgi:phage terminase large subunit GpA-like protein
MQTKNSGETLQRQPIDRKRIRLQRSVMLTAACRCGLDRVRRACAAAFRCRPRPKPSVWIQEKMRLDNTVEAGSGRYDISRRPWWKEILDAFDDPEVMSVAIAAATQIGKTLSLIGLILWAAENAPAPAMLVTPDRDTAVELRDRIYLNAMATIRGGGCRNLKVPPEHQWNTRYIDLGSMRVYLAWSGSRQRLRGRPCRYVFLTEVAVYSKGMKKAGDPVAAAHQRIKAFFRGFLYQESSPSEHPCRITELEQDATARYRWHVKCPQCGAMGELRFFPHKAGEKAGRDGIAGLRDAGGELLSVDLVRREAHYVCANGCVVESAEKQAMLEGGEMVLINARGGAVAPGQKPEPTSRRKLGFHLWSAHSESISFGDLAAAYVEAVRQMKLAEFFGNWLGLEYRPESRVPQWHALGKSNASYNARGFVPAEAWFLTCGVDVQLENNGCRVSCRAWAPGRTSWLVDWRWVERDSGDVNRLIRSDLETVTREFLQHRFPVVDANMRPAKNPLGKRELAVKLLAIDVGHDPRSVHAWLKSLPESWVIGEQARVRAVRGDHQLTPETRWQLSEWEQNVRTGEKYEGGMSVWRLYVYTFYELLTQLLSAEAGKAGGWHVTADCSNLGKAFLEQVVNFGRSIKFDEKTGTKKAIWGPRNHRVPVDFWDTSIYELIAAEMVVGDLGWEAEAWEAWRKGRGPDEVRRANETDTPRASLSDRDLGGFDDR